MKKGIPLLFCLFLLIFFGCNDRNIDQLRFPSTVTIDGVTYRTGFYGELFPKFGQKGMIGSESLDEERFPDDEGNYEFRRVNYEGHDWVHSYMGESIGYVYCAEDEWELTQDYYADPNHFDTYIGIGYASVQETFLLPNMDLEQYDALASFYKEHNYSPFNKHSNDNVLKQTLRLPADEYSKGACFYRVSDDGYFTTGKGGMYFVHDGKLLMVFYHDGGRNNNGIKEVVAVEVPDELGQYFVELIEQYK